MYKRGGYNKRVNCKWKINKKSGQIDKILKVSVIKVLSKCTNAHLSIQIF